MDETAKKLVRKKNPDAVEKPKVSAAFSEVYEHTAKSLEEIVTHRFYPDILTSLKQGKASMELRKRFLLRAVDETWVAAIEDILPVLDTIIRNPRKFIEEEEMILPIEQSKAIAPRSIRHLSQHVNNIAEISGDEIVPSKLLNVFREESMLTYENKFINTLIDRLYSFVARRFELAKQHPVDAKTTTLTYEQDFSQGEIRGKIHYSMELEEPADETEVERAYTYSYDVWRRVEKVYSVCLSYLTSPFCKSMTGFTVRSPIIHTNAIMKDKNLRQCLALWEFIESYENSGYTLLVDERVEDIDEDYIRRFYDSMAVEYLLFREKIHGDFDDEKTLDKALDLTFFEPRIVDELEPSTSEDFDEHYGLRIPEDIRERDMTELEHRVLAAIEATLDAVERAEAEEEAKKKPLIRRSFLSRIIQGSEALQTYYSEVKNCLLSYRGVRARLSWYGEAFYFGRDRYAYLAVKGKRLVAFLHLAPGDYNTEQYHHRDATSRGAKYEKTPLELRVASNRALRYCRYFISEMFRGVTELLDAFEPVDYRMPYETDAQLLGEGLIRIKDETVEKMPELPPEKLVPTDEKDVLTLRVREVPVPMPPEQIPAPAAEIPTEPVVDESLIIRSFLSRVIQGGEVMQDYYGQMKNALLSYTGMRSYVAWAGDTFVKGRVREAYIAVKGKNLVLFLNLDPDAYAESSYHQKDARRRGKKFEKTPFELRVSSPRALKYALFFIAEMMKPEEPAADFVPENYAMPYETDKALWRRELIKVRGEVPPEWLTDDPAPAPAPETAPIPEEVPEEIPAQEIPAPAEETPTPAVEIPPEPEETAAPLPEEPVSAPEKESETLIVRSFTSRLIQGSPEMTAYYGILKNALLAYEGVRCCTAWAGETYLKGRVREAYMAVKGKNLVLFLNLDPAAYAESSYHQKDARRRGKKFEKTPFELRVSSPRALKYALFFVEETMKDMKKDEAFKPSRYAMRYETDKALWRRELIKVKGKVPPEWLIDDPVTEKTTVIRSFTARLAQAPEVLSLYYNELANSLCSYKGVRRVRSHAGETFLFGRVRIAYMAVKGKNLVLFLCLDPDAYAQSSYHQKDARRRGKKFEKTPFELRISSPRAFRYALTFIADALKDKTVPDENYERAELRVSYATDEELLAAGLIKVKGAPAVFSEDGMIVTAASPAGTEKSAADGWDAKSAARPPLTLEDILNAADGEEAEAEDEEDEEDEDDED